eukprot:GFYU01030779.1.p1 GENE.GFYU01030779.1~~GFYU01030779.1.p1  ORF type:complete len:173 (-),score=31.41 GFYU01030779.1:175-642(-)
MDPVVSAMRLLRSSATLSDVAGTALGVAAFIILTTLALAATVLVDAVSSECASCSGGGGVGMGVVLGVTVCMIAIVYTRFTSTVSMGQPLKVQSYTWPWKTHWSPGHKRSHCRYSTRHYVKPLPSQSIALLSESSQYYSLHTILQWTRRMDKGRV